MNVPNYITSLIRTAVPALWGTVIAWLVAQNFVPQSLADQVGPDAILFLATISIAGYYALARWLETQKWFPVWLSAILLGTKTVPAYLTQYAAGMSPKPSKLDAERTASTLVGQPGDRGAKTTARTATADEQRAGGAATLSGNAPDEPPTGRHLKRPE